MRQLQMQQTVQVVLLYSESFEMYTAATRVFAVLKQKQMRTHKCISKFKKSWWQIVLFKVRKSDIVASDGRKEQHCGYAEWTTDGSTVCLLTTQMKPDRILAQYENFQLVFYKHIKIPFPIFLFLYLYLLFFC